jgi:hypothetical protein
MDILLCSLATAGCNQVIAFIIKANPALRNVLNNKVSFFIDLNIFIVTVNANWLDFT